MQYVSKPIKKVKPINIQPWAVEQNISTDDFVIYPTFSRPSLREPLFGGNNGGPNIQKKRNKKSLANYIFMSLLSAVSKISKIRWSLELEMNK